MWQSFDRGEHFTDETRSDGVWTPACYLVWMRRNRKMGITPVSFVIGMHPDDRAAYAPLIAAAEDDARAHGDVQIEVRVDEGYERL